MESQLRLTVVLEFLHSLHTLPEVIVTISGVHSLRLSGVCTVSQQRVELLGVSAQTVSGIRISAFLIYPTRSYCAYICCALLETFRYFYC